jgi:hypothetical protein
MSEDNSEEIEKIFNELMNSNSIKDLVKEDKNSIIKELIHMQESLLESVLNINALVHALHSDATFEVDPSLFELLGPLYKISEDFIAEAIGYNDTIEEYIEIEDEEESDDGE